MAYHGEPHAQEIQKRKDKAEVPDASADGAETVVRARPAKAAFAAYEPANRLSRLVFDPWETLQLLTEVCQARARSLMQLDLGVPGDEVKALPDVWSH